MNNTPDRPARDWHKLVHRLLPIIALLILAAIADRVLSMAELPII